MISQGKATKRAPALRVCTLLWIKETAQRLPLTDIPREAAAQGLQSTETYIKRWKQSKDIVFRRKVCVVGPSNTGKTSLVKSLDSSKPSLEHADDRTIGIDLFKWGFRAVPDGGHRENKHEITFWEFAGQDEYQFASSLFFSKRSLFMVCVDLHGYAVALAQSRFRADDDDAFDRLMGEFVRTKVMKRIRLVFDRQPDAEFLLVGTKIDAIRFSSKKIKAAQQDLKRRLEVLVADDVAEIERALTKIQFSRMNSRDRMLHVQALKMKSSNMALRDWIVVSCKDTQLVQSAKTQIESFVKNSDRSFAMPDAYSRVLDVVVRQRERIAGSAAKQRLRAMFVKTSVFCDRLPGLIQDEVLRGDLSISPPPSETARESPLVDLSRGPVEDNDVPLPSASECLVILRTLHDIGDVLLYEDHGAELLKNTTILDPMVMIDFIRQVITHHHNGEKIDHTTLMKLPFWVHVDDDLTLALKQVLHHFHLVYPSRGEMKWNSDLMVPAYWHTNVGAFREVAGVQLHLSDRGQEIGAYKVRWEYQFKSEMPNALFDQLVIASHPPRWKRDVCMDGFRFRDSESFVCRVVVGRVDGFRVIRLEAIATEEGKWTQFLSTYKALEKVLREYPGLLVCRCVVDDEGDRHRLEDIFDECFEVNGDGYEKWLPPNMAQHLAESSFITRVY